MTDDAYVDSLLAAALEYAAMGVYVFPAVVTRPDPAEHKKQVQPIGQWRKASTTDAATIRGWWGPGGTWRGAHVCIDTGKSLLVVLDAEAHGLAALEDLTSGTPNPAGTATTPSGGAHVFYREHYRVPIGNSGGALAPGVDVRGMGGLVFAAPSRDSAGQYTWVAGMPDFGALPVVPAAVIDRIKAVTRQASPVPSAGTGQVEAGPAQPFDTPTRAFTVAEARAFAQPYMDRLRDAPVGEINTRLNEAAKVLSHFIGPFWTADQARASLVKRLAPTAYDGATWKAEDTIASAFRSAASDWLAVLEDDPFAGPDKGSAVPEPSVVDALDAEFLTPDQVVERPPPHPLIMDWLDLDSLAWLIGKPGSYKSFLVLDWAAHIGAGLPWRGHRVEQGDVDYIVAEGVTGMSLRVRAWQDVHGPMKGVRFLPRPVQASGPEWAVLTEVERRHKPKLIILDTQARVTVGMDENDNTEMGKFIHRAEELRAATGACVLIVHHIGRHGEDARGASALDGAQSTEIKISRSDRGQLWALIEQDKQKDMAQAEPVELQLTAVKLGRDAVTGRELSSLVLAGVDPFGTAGTVRVRDWVDNLADNEAEITGIMRDHFPLSGGTKAEIKRVLQERRTASGRPRMPDGSWATAWDVLVTPEGELSGEQGDKRRRSGKGVFVRIAGTQRFMIDPDLISET